MRQREVRASQSDANLGHGRQLCQRRREVSVPRVCQHCSLIGRYQVTWCQAEAVIGRLPVVLEYDSWGKDTSHDVANWRESCDERKIVRRKVARSCDGDLTCLVPHIYCPDLAYCSQFHDHDPIDQPQLS